VNSRGDLPQWRLPTGVTRSLWHYTQATHIAYDYDEYFRGNSLFDFDQAFVARHLTTPGVVADLGCGTGRALVPLARRGFRGLAIDLSAHMLAVVGQKAADEQLPIDRVRANMAELDCFADGSIDHCICMFSTLGMVQTHNHRMRVLAHVRRMLRPGGKFILHVHNRWHHLFSAEGRRWLLTGLAKRFSKSGLEPGDKVFDYRGIPQMYLHAFTRHELVAMLRQSGFRPIEIVSLDTERRHPLRHPWWLGRLRANGWIVASE
jgi:ubiquinone/menaquinone biosynthesis C-methylase UbiE